MTDVDMDAAVLQRQVDHLRQRAQAAEGAQRSFFLAEAAKVEREQRRVAKRAPVEPARSSRTALVLAAALLALVVAVMAAYALR